MFSVILFNEALSRFLNLEVSALQADGKGKIISSPRVITADQVEATIEQGTEIPYQQATSSGATSVAFKKATLSLKVKPQITPDDNIIMDLNVHKDSVGAVTTAGPSIDTKQIVTEVLVQNGGTVVIGGIYHASAERSDDKSAGARRLAVSRVSCSETNTKQDDRNELLIFVSPRIMKSTRFVALGRNACRGQAAGNPGRFLCARPRLQRAPDFTLQSPHVDASPAAAPPLHSRKHLSRRADGRRQDFGRTPAC